MKLPIFQVDAFTDHLFGGNPAAVVLLDEWLADRLLQSIASENNLSETAFVVSRAERFDIRWFSPTVEVELCGHATLAAAHVLFEHGYVADSEVVFRYDGGLLSVEMKDDMLAMDFPALPAKRIEEDPQVTSALGSAPTQLHRSTNLLAVFDEQYQIEQLRPNFLAMSALATYAVIASAPGADCDFVSRFFAPSAGIPEDPVTGSAHCTLIPYWSQRLEKRVLHARQISARGGEIFCEDRGNRVTIAGRVRQYMTGEICIDLDGGFHRDRSMVSHARSLRSL